MNLEFIIMTHGRKDNRVASVVTTWEEIQGAHLCG